MGEFQMPILRRGRNLGHVTFDATDPIRRQADRNHGQTLERLRERGGLCWTELYCAVYNKRLSDVMHNDEAQEKVRAHFVDDLHWKWAAPAPGSEPA